jgi:hypothetical protein
MAMNYSLGNGQGPRKPKKMKRPITPEEAGKESRKKRLKQYTPQQNQQIMDTIERNNNVELAVKKGAILNKDEGDKSGGTEPGYIGDQRYKPLGKKKGINLPKFRTKRS